MIVTHRGHVDSWHRVGGAASGAARVYRAGARSRTLAAAILTLISVNLASCGGGSSTPPPTYTLSGTITSAITGDAIPSVRLTLTQQLAAGSAAAGTATSDATGAYRFSGLQNGSYVLAPSLANTSFFEALAPVTVNGADLGHRDFLAIEGANIATGIKFLPDSRIGGQVLHTSIAVTSDAVIFTDSSDTPLKKLSLTDSTVTALASRFVMAESVVRSGPNTYWVAAGKLNVTTPDGKTSVLAQGLRDPVAGGTADVVIDSAHVYWVHNAVSSPCSPSCSWVVDQVPVGGGAPITVATASRRVAALAIDADHVYWEEEMLEPVAVGCQCGSTIKSVPKAGGPVTVLVDGLLNGPPPQLGPGYTPGSWMPTGGIAVTPTQIIFGVAGTPYQIDAVPIGGGGVTTLASIGVNPGSISGGTSRILVAGANAYWINPDTQTLDSVPLAGGAWQVVASGVAINPFMPAAFAITATDAFWTYPGPANSSCCGTNGAGRIETVPLAGGPVRTLLDGLDVPMTLSVDNSVLCFGEAWRLGILPVVGGTATTLASGLLTPLARIAVDQLSVYVLEDDSIKTVPLAGGIVEQLAAVQGRASGTAIAADGANVYWTTIGAAGAGVQAVATSGGTPVTVVAPITVGAATCYPRIVVDLNNVYWTSGSSVAASGCAVRQASLQGGAVTTILDDAALTDFTIDATTIYLSRQTSTTASIDKAPIGGGTMTPMAQGAAAASLVNNATHVFGIDAHGVAIEVPKTVTSVGSGWLGPAAGVGSNPQVALDDLSVGPNGWLYLTSSQSGAIVALH